MEASTVEANLEKRIVKLAKDVSDAVDSVIPRLLLQIQGAFIYLPASVILVLDWIGFTYKLISH